MNRWTQPLPKNIKKSGIERKNNEGKKVVRFSIFLFGLDKKVNSINLILFFVLY
jgi:hypothetical protein